MGGTLLADQYPPQYPPQYSQQYPQGGQPQYPQGGQPQYPQGGQPQYQPYPQAPYGQAAPSSQYPYNAPGQPRVATQARTVSNPWATRALIYGILSIVALGIAFFTGYIFLGLAGFYAIYYAIRGMSYSRRLPGATGLAQAIIGLILSIIGVLGTIGLLILSAVANSSGA